MKDHIRQKLSFAVLILALLISSVAVAEIYKTVDENGNVVYTDRAPGPDAQPLELRELSVISPQRAANSVDENPGDADEGPAGVITDIHELRQGYQDFMLASPRPDQTFWGSENTAPFAWSAQYGLQPGMKVRFYVDGVLRQEVRRRSVNIDALWRGTHQAYAVLIDGQDRMIATTQVISFHIKQNSVLLNPNRNQGG